MNYIPSQSDWTELKNKLRLLFPQLAESDFHHQAGKEETMLRIIEYKLGKTKSEMRKIITDFSMFSPGNSNNI